MTLVDGRATARVEVRAGGQYVLAAQDPQTGAFNTTTLMLSLAAYTLLMAGTAVLLWPVGPGLALLAWQPRRMRPTR